MYIHDHQCNNTGIGIFVVGIFIYDLFLYYMCVVYVKNIYTIIYTSYTHII